jgi:hypothetical protein
LDTATKEFLAIEFKRTQDARSNYVERATAVAQEQYKSPLAGLQAVGQVKGWKVQLVQQIVFVGGTCGSLHVESFNRNVKALGVRESKWDPIRKKLVRRLLEEQHKVLRLYFAQKGGTRSKGGDRGNWKDREHVQHCQSSAKLRSTDSVNPRVVLSRVPPLVTAIGIYSRHRDRRYWPGTGIGIEDRIIGAKSRSKQLVQRGSSGEGSCVGAKPRT